MAMVDFARYADGTPLISLNPDIMVCRDLGDSYARSHFDQRHPRSASSTTWKGLPQGITKNYNYFGNDSPALARVAAYACTSFGVEGQLEEALTEFLKFARVRYLRPEQTAVCFTVRVETQKDDYILPNPHQDGDGHSGQYWKVKTGDPPIIKLGTTLLGPGTVFYNNDTPEAHRAVSVKAHEKRKFHFEQTVRRWLVDFFKDTDTRQVGIGEVAAWHVGNVGSAAIHSEPDMSNMPTGRVFVSLVPGTPEQIKELARNWGATFQDSPKLSSASTPSDGEIRFN